MEMRESLLDKIKSWDEAMHCSERYVKSLDEDEFEAITTEGTEGTEVALYALL